MKIEFLEVKFKNFLSYPNDFSTISLNSHKTNLICGINGSGKSTILDVLSFALYNKPFRDINKPELVNEVNNRDCLVELTFLIGPRKYLLRRGIRPNLFEIFEDDILLPGRADSVDYQEILEKQIVRCSHRSFLQTVILGSGNYVPFMQLATPQRREVIESLLDLKAFSAMAVTIRQGIAEISAKMVDNRSEKVLLEKEIDIIEQNQRLQDECSGAMITAKEMVKLGVQNNIIKSRGLLEMYRAGADTHVDAKKKLWENAVLMKKYEEVQSEIAAKTRSIDLEIQFLQEHENCPTCKQPIGEFFILKTIKTKSEKLDEMRDASIKLLLTLEKLSTKKDRLTEAEETRQEFLQGVQQETFRVEQWLQQISTLDEEIEAIRVKMKEPATKGDVELLKFRMGVLFKQYNRQEDDKYQQSVALDLLPLIKASVIRKYIPFFNKQILFYLRKFDSPIRFSLNEHFEETILHRGRDKLGYGSLSEGEKFRVNLAVLFAWRAVAKSRGSVDCNLLFLDEIMDSSLDAEGVESFMRIIGQLNDATCVYVISHKDGDFADSFDRVIEVKKQSNFSRIVGVIKSPKGGN
jgi:DNA repair exonuclease SbcCD ATPase subunit